MQTSSSDELDVDSDSLDIWFAGGDDPVGDRDNLVTEFDGGGDRLLCPVAAAAGGGAGNDRSRGFE